MSGKPVEKKKRSGREGGRPVRRVTPPKQRDQAVEEAAATVPASGESEVQEQSVLASTGYALRRQQKVIVRAIK